MGGRTSPILAAMTLAALSCSASAQGGDSTCPRDVLVAQSMQRQAVDQLEQADGELAKSCRIWRRHVETMRRVASVYGRCLSGSARNERLAQVQASEKEFSAAIQASCKGQ